MQNAIPFIFFIFISYFTFFSFSCHIPENIFPIHHNPHCVIQIVLSQTDQDDNKFSQIYVKYLEIMNNEDIPVQNFNKNDKLLELSSSLLKTKINCEQVVLLDDDTSLDNPLISHILNRIGYQDNGGLYIFFTPRASNFARFKSLRFGRIVSQFEIPIFLIWINVQDTGNCKMMGLHLLVHGQLLSWSPLQVIPSFGELKTIKKHQNKNQHGFQLVMKRDEFVFNIRRCEIPKVFILDSFTCFGPDAILPILSTKLNITFIPMRMR
jgi:hypothetical protein